MSQFSSSQRLVLASTALACLLFIVCTAASPTDQYDRMLDAKSASHELVSRASQRIQYVCHWPDLIRGTNTTPITLLIGLAVGGGAGIIMAFYMFYQVGRNAGRP